MNNDIDIKIDAQGCLVFQFIAPVECLFRYRNWPCGFQQERFEEGNWDPEEMDYGIPLLQLATQEKGESPVHQFLESIPLKVRDLVFPYRHCQSLMLTWICKSEAASQLLESAPNLLWLLIGTANEESWSENIIESLLYSRRTKILSSLVGTSDKSTLKLLNKVKLKSGCSAEFNALRSALEQSPRLMPLQSLNEIPIHVIHAANHYHWFIQGKAFFALGAEEFEQLTDFRSSLRGHDRYWTDALNVARLLQIQDANLALRRCPDFDAVRRLHDRWTDRLNQRQRVATNGSTSFPAPPFNGNQEIHPIKTLEDLREEGRLMHHCVASYVGAIQAGRCYIYRILSPERATVELGFRGDSPVIRQVKLAYNRAPSQETLDAIYQWIHSEKGDHTG